MTKRRKILLACVGVVVLVAVLLGIINPEPQSEPSYAGKALSGWVMEYEVEPWPHDERDLRNLLYQQRKKRAEAADAIRHIGTNAIPHLLTWIQYNRPPWKDKLNWIIGKVPGATPSWRENDRNLLLKKCAPNGFQALGSQARGAIPDLARFMNNPSTAYQAGMSLGFIGKEALPSLLTALTNQAGSTRVRIPEFIAVMGIDARPAVPALLDCFNDPNSSLRNSASNALRFIDPEALKRATQK